VPCRFQVQIIQIQFSNHFSTGNTLPIHSSHHHMAELTPRRENSDYEVIVLALILHSDDMNTYDWHHGKLHAKHIYFANAINISTHQSNFYCIHAGWGCNGASNQHFSMLFNLLQQGQRGWNFHYKDKPVKIVSSIVMYVADMLEINSDFGLLAPNGHHANFRTWLSKI
jgi:hypothetical protein